MMFTFMKPINALVLVIFSIQSMSKKCFVKCVTAPGTSLDTKEQVGCVFAGMFTSEFIQLLLCRNVCPLVLIDSWKHGTQYQMFMYLTLIKNLKYLSSINKYYHD